jgi:Ca2+-transporting ATPase
MPIPDVVTEQPQAWHVLAGDDVLARLDSQETGLTQAVAGTRLQSAGPNQLAESKPIRPWAMFLGQFKNLIIWVLIGAAGLSASLGEWIDAAAILVIVIVNAIIGFLQEYQAEQALAALRALAAPQARVRRGGQVQLLPSRLLVPGDIVLVEAGDTVPADLRLLSSAALRCQEAMLTGEAEAVDKSTAAIPEAEVPLGDRRNLLFMGTTVVNGTGEAVVVATGMATEIGRIAGLVASAAPETETPLQKRLADFGRKLVLVTLGIVTLIFLLGIWRGEPFVPLLLTAVSLAVAAIPEGLPAVVTIALALGVQRMARERALVRHMPAVETLGATTVICSDKTGTLTQGRMQVQEVATAEGMLARSDWAQAGPLWRVAVLCNDAHPDESGSGFVGDPTEGALLQAASSIGIHIQAERRDWPRIGVVPFDSDRKRMSALCTGPDDGRQVMVKGAPDVLFARCSQLWTEGTVVAMDPAWRSRLESLNADLAAQGLRVLAFAFRDCPPDADGAELLACEDGLTFAGLLGLADPPRPEAKQAIAQCRQAGIRVVMITGDQVATATAIGRQLGLVDEATGAMTGSELDTMDDDTLAERVAEVGVFARVTAAHKLRIVRAWQANQGIIAMTGDGVNDAPAIKGADVGIAMGATGTDVAKEAADVVVLDDNFATIVSAVRQGRGIYDNIRKAITYLLAGNVGELIFVAACMVAGLPMPLLPIHLLWINLVSDGLPALALATDPIDGSVMQRPPRSPSATMADREFARQVMITGLVTAATVLAVYVYARQTSSAATARTSAFAVLVYARLLLGFAARSSTLPLVEIGWFGNTKLAAIIGISILIQPWMHHVPILQAVFQTTHMGLWDCFLLLAVGAVPLTLLEIGKMLRRRP